MSVLIKGMDMPETCFDCAMFVSGWCDAMDKDLTYEIGKTGKPDWCPLVEVPTPHGDLIDKGALNYNANYFEPLIHKADIDWMPIIIEAESEVE